jgi:hypothetical protein
MNARMKMPRTARAIAGLALAAVVYACAPRHQPEPNPLQALPVGVRLTVEEVSAWAHQHQLSADLDGDGVDETITLAADVEVAGRPLWEDGHRWALLIGDAGRQTLAYSAFVPQGFVEAAVLQPSSTGSREVLVLERGAGQVRALSIGYSAPGEGVLVSAAYYQLESWLPGFARLPD